MYKFGYIIDPRETRFYEVSGGFNKLKLHLPIIKEEVLKISSIYDKNNNYMGDILSVPLSRDEEEIKAKLLNYLEKSKLDFICLGDAVKYFNGDILNEKVIITGIKGIAYVSLLYMEKYLKDELNKLIHEAEIIIVLDEYNALTTEYIRFISSKANFIKLIGENLEINEKFLEEIYTEHGISISLAKSYNTISSNWDILINLSRKLKLKNIKKGDKKGIIIDPFFLIKENSDYFIIVNELGMMTENIVIFNKLNIINNIYAPQFIESIARRKYGRGLDDIYQLIKNEIEENNYSLI